MADEKTGGSGRAAEYSPRSENYQQLGHRLAPAFIRDVLENFNQRTLTTAQAVGQLGVSRSRLYVLAAAYLAARTQTAGTLWQPGHSGGDHATPWPQPVLDLLRKRLSCTPPCPYSFVASEALRLHDFKLDRAQVRRWALAHRLAHAVPPKKVRAGVRRWQRHRIGELWQLDASPHRWFPHSQQSCPMLNMLDDCSRLFTGSKLYERELLLSYFDFLPAAFQAHGRPLQLYVDYHSLFFTRDPDALTQLGWALKFYDISLRYAPTPQAKGKIEREHQFWQGRLPAYFASEKIHDIATANTHIDGLRAHHNAHEVHRELRQTPQRAWDQANKENRSALRPAPRCPWWPYVWSVRTTLKVGPDGRVPIGTQRLRLEKPPGNKLVLCFHPSGHHSVLAAQPDPKSRPILLFTDCPI
jgi:hypothetical protein